MREESNPQIPPGGKNVRAVDSADHADENNLYICCPELITWFEGGYPACFLPTPRVSRKITEQHHGATPLRSTAVLFQGRITEKLTVCDPFYDRRSTFPLFFLKEGGSLSPNRRNANIDFAKTNVF